MNISLKGVGLASTQYGIIIDTLFHAARALTRREISGLTGIEPGAVSGRVNELLKTGKVLERGKRRCSVTGKKVKVVTVI